MGIRKVFVTAACGVGIAGAMVFGSAEAHADAGDIMDRAVAATCHTLDNVPTVAGVDGSVHAMKENGFIGKEIGQILGTAAYVECTEHEAIIKAWVAQAPAVIR